MSGLVEDGVIVAKLPCLERGIHALHSTMGVREYARAVALDAAQITREAKPQRC